MAWGSEQDHNTHAWRPFPRFFANRPSVVFPHDRISQAGYSAREKPSLDSTRTARRPPGPGHGARGKTMTKSLEDKIRDRAYELWEQDGRVHGRSDEHWLKASLEVIGTMAEG